MAGESTERFSKVEPGTSPATRARQLGDAEVHRRWARSGCKRCEASPCDDRRQVHRADALHQRGIRNQTSAQLKRQLNSDVYSIQTSSSKSNDKLYFIRQVTSYFKQIKRQRLIPTSTAMQITIGLEAAFSVLGYFLQWILQWILH